METTRRINNLTPVNISFYDTSNHCCLAQALQA